MESISKYVSTQKELLVLERDEEKRESIAAGDGKKLSSLEHNGVSWKNLNLSYTVRRFMNHAQSGELI